MNELKAVWIGMEDHGQFHQACGSAATRNQIKQVCSMPILIEDMDASWLRDELEPIAQDRAVRIDQNTPLNCRPRFAIVWYTEDGVVRVEAYTGYNQLRQEIDYAAPGFVGVPTYREDGM